MNLLKNMITAITKDISLELEKIALQDIGSMYQPDIHEELEGIEKGKYFGFYAIEDSKPVGYVVAKKTVNTYQLMVIAVDKSYRNKGYGSQLVDRVFSEIQKQGGRILNVITDADANDSLCFYLKNGFVLTGIVQDEFISGVAQAHLTRRVGFNP
ncbi:GNAT family N-acetyltransferase [Nitrosomonas sp.]|uniref:GNAT family N-acetyltransferase n=1 Tax=Nitrosomonas sp. TaxID=42353 RepID=UPI001D6F141B|nr:GNAT family N-acetyltransferase [Nitrosomonas sp.]MBX3618084.1 GNAT family N-acetyltransferase [Nitrosomonas sp.]